MSSPCLLRAAPLSQPLLREVKISLKGSGGSSSGGRESATSAALHRTAVTSRSSASSSSSSSTTPARSRSTPPARRAPRAEPRRNPAKADAGGGAGGRGGKPKHHLESNGSVLHVTVATAAQGPPPDGRLRLSLTPVVSSSTTTTTTSSSAPVAFSTTTSSTTSSSTRRQRPSPKHTAAPAPPPADSSSNPPRPPPPPPRSSSSTARRMKKGRWLSSSASNICFNSILEGRFRQLQDAKRSADEREAVQKKTFTKWVNSILARVGCRISDLYLDLRDGRMLIKLLENVDKALQFLKEQRVHLENMGSHDIVDGNHRLILGLIWTIILRFQIQDIVVETGQADQKQTRSAKDALLLWCQMKTAGYPNVNITNFTTCWKDGMAFNALIHKHRPDLVDYNTLRKSNPTQNLQNAFNAAEQGLRVAKLLDPEDVFTENPDEKSIITYVVSFYHYFSKMKQLAAIETEKRVDKYEGLASDLLAWIEQTITVLNNRKLANSLTGVQQQLFQEKGNLEVLLFTIQSRMRANNQKVFTPKDGALVADINRAWERLEWAEHERERVLREELIRQEKLEQMARRFDRKAAMRETWLQENQRLVAQDNFGYDLAAVEAAKKKHDAIETDISAYEERVQALVAISGKLETERYHDAKRVDARKDNVLRLWDYLQELLRARRGRLDKNLTLQRIFQEMLHIIGWMDDMKHLLEVEDLLQKHALVENDIALQAERVRSANANALTFANGDSYKPCDPQVIRDRVQHLDLCYQELCALAAQRRARLEQSRRFWNFLWETAELESWVKEKEHIFSSLDYGRDLAGVLILQGKHSAFEDELGARRAHLSRIMDDGEQMIRAEHFGAPAVRERSEDVRRQWQQLEDLATFRKQSLGDTQRFFQFQGDGDDLLAWLLDAKRQMASEEVGHDEYTTRRLLRKHRDLRGEVAKNGTALDALSKQADALPEELRSTPDIQRRLRDVRDLYLELMALADLRQKRLDDAMALYTVFSESDACELWMGQKETWLVGLEVPDKLEDLEVIQNRLSILANDMANVQSRVDDVNQAVKQLEDSRHPRTKEIKDCQTRLNKRWEAFKAMVAEKKRRVDSALSLHSYGMECDETEVWIKDKTRVIESTQDLGNDLAAVMTMQRKLFGMERDLAAIDTKRTFLGNEADQLALDHPELADDIRARRGQLDAAWDTLKKTLRDREDSLGEVSKLQTFLQDMDDFQSWLFKTQKAVASEETPTSLPEAEGLLSLHDALRDDIGHHQDDFLRVKETGARVTQGQEDDPQYQQLGERLNGLDRGWTELQKMWDRRKDLLDQSLGFQQFMRDAKAADTILNNQEYTLAMVDMPDTLDGAEKALKKHEDFVSTVAANEEKIDGTVRTGQRLLDAQNLYARKVQDKMSSIEDRHNGNKRRAKEVSAKLKDNRDLQHFLQNTQDLTLWINEKMLTARDTSYDEARNLHSKWLKHQAFMAELEGQELIESKPVFQPVVLERLAALHALWSELETTTQEKARLLFDANRSELFDQSLADITKCLGELRQQLRLGEAEEEVKDLTNANILLKKHQVTENQVRDRARELEELQEAVQRHGGAGEDQPQMEAEQQALQGEFQQLLAPLAQRRNKLEAAKAIHQYYRDLADELLWVEERLPLATSQEHGHNLQTVRMLQKKHQTLQREIEGHQPRVDEAQRIAQEAGALEEAWSRLREEMARRKGRLFGADEAQQYLNDAEEAEAWIGEQELYMISDEQPKDEQSSMLMLKRHLVLKQAVDDYSQPMRRLAARAQRMLAEEHPQGEAIIRREGQVEKQYAGLRDLTEERQRKLDHTFQHFLLSREVEDLEHWIAERDVVASSQEMGHDLDHVTLLRDRFREFARDTGTAGQERVDLVNGTIDELIATGHSQASELAEWKDTVNESWADLLELIDTRAQLLTASYELLKYFDDGKELVVQIQDKQKELPKDAETFHRMHAAFQRDITSLDTQVHQFQDTATRLHAQYAGERADAIQAMEQEVVEAWRSLQQACDGRRAELEDTADKYHFFTMVKDLLAWMEAVVQQIETQEKPRDVASVELLQQYHQGIRSEIDTRVPDLTHCQDLETLWRWDWLRLLLEVCQFSRDASVAEAWLVAQEPYAASRDVGHSVNEVEKLLKRHEAFEKSTASWEERFCALERLTTLELLELRQQQQGMEEFRKEQLESERDSRREDTGFAEDSSQLYTMEKQSPSQSGSGPVAAEEAEPSSAAPVASESVMAESGSMELDRSVSTTLPSEPRAATMPTEGPRAPATLLEGPLGRKHDVEGPGKKASNR
ncbi:hypothetical protein NHX12_019786, partial [Muraenolepis orangiensis]